MTFYVRRPLLPVAIATLAAAMALVEPAALAQSPSVAAAPLDTPIGVQFKQFSMAAMLHDLSQRYHISVLADSEPLLKAADLDSKGTLRDALERVAETFDYAVRPGQGGIVLFTKRFQNPDERPQMSAAELRQTAADMLAILPSIFCGPVDPPRWVTLMRQLALRLPAEQMAAMKDGRRLTLRDLSQQEQTTVGEIIAQRAFGVARSSWQTLQWQLDRFADSVIRLKKKGVFNGVDGKSAVHFDAVHESRSPSGIVTNSVLGGIRREARP